MTTALRTPVAVFVAWGAGTTAPFIMPEPIGFAWQPAAGSVAGLADGALSRSPVSGVMIPVAGGGVEGRANAALAIPQARTMATHAIHIFMPDLLDGGMPRAS
jgi:hypothetical protein